MKFEKDAIIVCTQEGSRSASAFSPGRMYKILSVEDDILRVNWEGKRGYGVYSDDVRLATEIEIAYFEAGSKYISDIPKDMIINNYSLY